MKQEVANSIGKVISFIRQLVGSGSEAIPVLCYHHVLHDNTEGKIPIYAITPEQFESQLLFLARHGFQSLSLDEFRQIMIGSRTAPSRAILVTFDDGFADSYHIALPIANHYGVKLNVFIVTSLIDKSESSLVVEKDRACCAYKNKFPKLRRLMTWEELSDMQCAGVGIGLHGHRHCNLATTPYAVLCSDLQHAVKLFKEHFGCPPWAFALPYGGVGQYNMNVLKTLRDFGLEMVFSTIRGRARPAQGVVRPNVIPRITIHRDKNLDLFELEVFGVLDWLESVERFKQIAWECSTKVRSLFTCG